MKSRKVPSTMKDRALSSGSVSKEPKVKMFFIICAIQWIAISQLIAFFTFQKTWACRLGTTCELKLIGIIP